MSRGIVIYGDPHGEWRPLLRAIAEERPDGVVILGDCDLSRPLREQIKPVFDADIRVRWIPGNHDCGNEVWHERLWGDYPECNLHGRWAQLGELIVAGLGGVFKEHIWYPRCEAADPVCPDRRAYPKNLKRTERWRGGLPLHIRDAIFSKDVQSLSGLRADVLVTHEAPSCHRHGFVGID